MARQHSSPIKALAPLNALSAIRTFRQTPSAIAAKDVSAGHQDGIHADTVAGVPKADVALRLNF
jgi:hypothetical protein